MARLGLYFDLRNPPPWRQDWGRLYGLTLELCEEAERLGAASVWFSEHHGFEDGYLTQPLTYAAAVAARTSHIRIGTAVVVAPFRHPVLLAEEAAVVDLISQGRLDLGLGAGYRIPEFLLYERDITQRYVETDATVRRIRQLWSEHLLQPRPVQDPLPIWLGYLGPQGARRCGLLGEGLLTLDPSLLQPYLDGLRTGDHDLSAARMSGALPYFATHDPESDWPTIASHLSYQIDSYRRYEVEGTGRTIPAPLNPERARAAGFGHGLLGLIVDTPQVIAARIREYVAGEPVDTVFSWTSLAGMPESMVVKQIHLVCTELAPLIADI